MKKAAVIPVLILICFHYSAVAQTAGFATYAAVCPFEYSGDIWTTDMGTVLAEELRKRLHQQQRLYIMPVQEARQLLAEAGIANAGNAAPHMLRDVFWKKNVRLVVTGEIENIFLIRDVDGTPYADVEISFNVIDLFNAEIIYTDSVKYRTKASGYVTKETPYDRDIAFSILNGGANRVAQRFQSGLDQYFRQNRLRRIY